MHTHSPGRFVRWLATLGREDVHLVGGKGASLGELVREGFPVPPGFCLTAEAFREFLATTRIDREIDRLVVSATSDTTVDLERVSSGIRRLIESARIPIDISAELLRAYDELGRVPVAVSSSATSEDQRATSFAGQHDTFLNVSSPASLEKAVLSSWGSFWTARALAYRRRTGIDHFTSAMAVTVQRMIAADVSGTMFTINPTTGEPDQLVVNSAFGLGEAVVAGRLTPDTYALSKKTRAVLSRDVVEKPWMLVADGDSVLESVGVPRERRHQSSLTDDQLRQVADLGARIELLYGAPQDVEWAISGDRLYVLQARPVTTSVADPRPPVRRRARFEQFVLDSVLDYFPSPPYPFDRAIWLGLVDSALELMRIVGLRPPAAEEIIRLETDGQMRLAAVWPRLTLRFLLFPITLLKAVWRGFRHDPESFRRLHLPGIERQIAEWMAVDHAGASDQSLITLVKEVATYRDQVVWTSRLDYMIGGWAAVLLLHALLAIARGRRPDLRGDLLADLEHPSAAMQRELGELAAMASGLAFVRKCLEKDSGPTVLECLSRCGDGEAFLTAFHSFLRRFGARTGVFLPYPSALSWLDDPAPLITTLRLTIQRLGGSPERSSADSPARHRFEAAHAEVGNALARWPWRLFGLGRMFAFALGRARAMWVERDTIAWTYERLMVPARRAMHEAGRRLASRGMLRARGDARFLTLNELEKALTGRAPSSVAALVEQRRSMRSRSEANWRDAIGVQARRPEQLRLRGTGASTGTVTGVGRVIRSQAHFADLKPGEVLVCRTTTPAWTPLFTIAAAVVADLGGALSHAAIVARELGIPCVLGTRTATMDIHDGDLVTVDGTRGEVWWEPSTP